MHCMYGIVTYKLKHFDAERQEKNVCLLNSASYALRTELAKVLKDYCLIFHKKSEIPHTPYLSPEFARGHH